MCEKRLVNPVSEEKGAESDLQVTLHPLLPPLHSQPPLGGLGFGVLGLAVQLPNSLDSGLVV